LKLKNKFANKLNILLSVGISLLVLGGLAVNIRREILVNREHLPSYVTTSNGFMRWNTNLKNKEVNFEAQEFTLLESSEVFNTKSTTVTTAAGDPTAKATYDQTIAVHKNIKKVVYSPNGAEFIDFQNEARDNYLQGQVRFYGLRGDKVVDARAVGCYTRANCYFDRGYFITNDEFVVSELSLADSNSACTPDSKCTYTFKLHLVDVTSDKQYIYESPAVSVVETKLIPEL
jgi:hypothetical protein